MRRSVPLAALALIVVLFTTTAAQAGTGALPANARPHGRDLVAWQRIYFDWLGASATNPLFDPAPCGEVVQDVYLLPSSFGSIDIECDVPRGTMVLAPGAFSFAEIPTFGETDAEILASVEEGFAELISVSMSVDGQTVPLGAYTRRAGAYDVGPVQAGSFYDLICEDPDDPFCVVDFEPGDVVRLASVGQFVMLRPLPRGTHVIIIEAEFTFGGIVARMTLHVR